MQNQSHLSSARVMAVLAAMALSVTACTGGVASTEPSSASAASAVPSSGPSSDATSAAESQSPTASAGAETASVTISGFSFGEPEISVPVGELQFVNADAVAHTVTEGENGAAVQGARFDEVIGAGETIVVTLPAPGDYQITCQFHPQMHLVVHAE